MKKFVMMLMLAVFSLGAYAQTQQGQSAVARIPIPKGQTKPR